MKLDSPSKTVLSFDLFLFQVGIREIPTRALAACSAPL